MRPRGSPPECRAASQTVVDHLRQDRIDLPSADRKRVRPGQELVEDDPERVHVAPRIDSLLPSRKALSCSGAM